MRSRHAALLALALAGALAFSTTPAHAGRKAVKPPTTYWSRGDTATGFPGTSEKFRTPDPYRLYE